MFWKNFIIWITNTISKWLSINKNILNKKYTLLPDPVDFRDLIFRSINFINHEELPNSIDLRDKMSPVVDQGELGSCSANAIASGLREYLEMENHQRLVRLSRLYLYWHERQMEGTVNDDSGACLRDGMKVLCKLGCAPESDWPYDIMKFSFPPSLRAERNASQFKINSYHRVTSLSMLKTSIAEKLPVVIGITLYESFESDKVAQTGIVPFPKKYEVSLGGHAMLAVGYDDLKQQVIVRNSWGEEWGDKGYCYLPYTYFTKGIVNDMWVGK